MGQPNTELLLSEDWALFCAKNCNVGFRYEQYWPNLIPGHFNNTPLSDGIAVATTIGIW